MKAGKRIHSPLCGSLSSLINSTSKNWRLRPISQNTAVHRALSRRILGEGDSKNLLLDGCKFSGALDIYFPQEEKIPLPQVSWKLPSENPSRVLRGKNTRTLELVSKASLGTWVANEKETHLFTTGNCWGFRN
uniref:Uncharacterized protein n=1 Tax=Molossus molossus TaxID=27622 RepID=A0A7J8CRQ9_MOLMO|nr:hypothetical protein HJG59_009777 [Molossus molossus]